MFTFPSKYKKVATWESIKNQWQIVCQTIYRFVYIFHSIPPIFSVILWNDKLQRYWVRLKLNSSMFISVFYVCSARTIKIIEKKNVIYCWGWNWYWDYKK